jgi:hypothetical protein
MTNPGGVQDRGRAATVLCSNAMCCYTDAEALDRGYIQASETKCAICVYGFLRVSQDLVNIVSVSGAVWLPET